MLPKDLRDLLMNDFIEVEQQELDDMTISIMEMTVEDMKQLKTVELEVLMII
jgi:hypothetical protein